MPSACHVMPKGIDGWDIFTNEGVDLRGETLKLTIKDLKKRSFGDTEEIR